MDVKTAIAEMLRDEGVSFVSCFPENMLIDAFVAAGIRPVVCRSERAVLNVADGYARVAGPGRFGVAVMQYGPGIENAYAGVAQASGDSVPVFVLPRRRTRLHNAAPTDFDAVSNLRGVTKWAAEIVLPEQVPVVLRRAITALRNGRGGPVLVEVPADIGDEEVDRSSLAYVSPKAHRTGRLQRDGRCRLRHDRPRSRDCCPQRDRDDHDPAEQLRDSTEEPGVSGDEPRG